MDECFSNPCQNGGSCHKLKQSGFSCECKEGYGGKSLFLVDWKHYKTGIQRYKVITIVIR